STLDEVLPMLDMVLLLLVNPGFGGQQMIPGSLNKIARMRKRLDDAGLAHVALEVDGGVTANNAAAVAAAGAGILVAGSAVFGGASPIACNVRALRASS
ncbi:MAG TPA: ribulose-phosphate 3-epimerase, partial [Anaerolineae bacterium]|nr:ribulose-phosphate 3-epimerase [Anaerolineae bacterium]